MAISEDTAALVAAQLTLAWATRIGAVGGRGAPVTPHDVAIVERYLKFRDAVAETHIGKARQVPIGGV